MSTHKTNKRATKSRSGSSPATPRSGKKAQRQPKGKARKTIRSRSAPTTQRRRDDFTMTVLRLIAHEVGFRCSNPECQAPTHGPSREKGISHVGVGAHITAAAPGGPRYDETLSKEERRSAANAIWLCNSCGRLVDNDASTYTIAELAQWKRDAIEHARKAVASGGRSTTDGLFAAQIEIQKQTLAHQKEAHEAQLRDQKLQRFSDMYSLFLQEAKAYADAIEAYWTKMYVTGYQLDNSAREALQKPIKDANAAMDRALQPILLADPDETRGRLRWELIRSRGLEPVVDTIANQRSYAECIHYHLLRLRDGITRLQDNVREALGHPPRVRSEADRKFVEQTLADAQQKCDAVDADIQAQFRTLMQQHQQRETTSASSATSEVAVVDVDPIRNRVWNVLHAEIFEDDEHDDVPRRRGAITLAFLREIWSEVLSLPVDDVPRDFVAAWRVFRRVFMACPEPTLYAIVEHAGADKRIRQKLDAVLESSGARYRFVDDEVRPVVAER